MAQNNKDLEVINIRQIMHKIKANHKSFYLPLGIVFVLSCIYIFSMPRYYRTDSKLSPEVGKSMSESTLGTLAASFGFDLDNIQTSDAINPLLYPDLMEDNAFVSRLFNINVETQDGEISTNYYNYLEKHQKSPWWGSAISWFKNLFKEAPKDGNSNDEFDPYDLSRNEDDIATAIRGNVILSVDKKTGVITINVTDQDPLICRTIADSTQAFLQEYITEYRTKKARIDVQYYAQLCAEALDSYNEARIAYSEYADANRNAIQQSVATMTVNLENDMQLKYNNYTAYNTQLQAAKAKLQERTPAFSILKGAAIPVRPAGPKRMIFVATMLILAFVVKAFWLVKSDLHFKF